MADSNLPIDIQTNKLLDWLISRRHCKKDYQKSLDLIRSKIVLAIQDMPQIDEVKELLQKNVFDYYVCQRIIEILKNTDKDSKNIFGQYTSKRFQDWQEILKLYEKDNVFLAEDGQILIRMVNYEVPSLKKLQSKYEQQISELERSIETSKKQSKNFLNEYHLNCKKLGIEGQDIKTELYSRLEILPKKMNDLAENIPKLIQVCNYYKSFVLFISQSEIECLPELHYLLAKGNTTYFEYRTGNAPESIEEFKLGSIPETMTKDNTDSGDNDGIDFGDQIDFGDDTTSTDTPSTGNGDFVKLDQEELNNEINWDIGEETANVTNNEKNIKTEGNENQSSKVARGDDAHSVLLNSQFRSKFINELIEIEYFLQERINEMESDHALGSYFLQSAPSVVQMTTVDGLREMLTIVCEIREEFESPALKALYYMKDNPKYIDNLYKKLNHLKELSEKATKKAQDLEKKRTEFLEELSKIGPQISMAIQRTRTIQQRLQEAISKRYNNRPVNIMGGVQVL